MVEVTVHKLCRLISPSPLLPLRTVATIILTALELVGSLGFPRNLCWAASRAAVLPEIIPLPAFQSALTRAPPCIISGAAESLAAGDGRNSRLRRARLPPETASTARCWWPRIVGRR